MTPKTPTPPPRLMNPQTDAHGKPLPEVRCPNCQHLLNCASAPNDDSNRPKPGDLSICIQCGTVLTFTPTMELRRLSPSEFAALDPESKHLVSRVLSAMRQANQRNYPPRFLGCNPYPVRRSPAPPCLIPATFPASPISG